MFLFEQPYVGAIGQKEMEFVEGAVAQKCLEEDIVRDISTNVWVAFGWGKEIIKCGPDSSRHGATSWNGTLFL